MRIKWESLQSGALPAGRRDFSAPAS